MVNKPGMNILKTLKRIIWMVIPLLAALWANSATASSVTVNGYTVDSVTGNSAVGITSGGTIKYYIPLASDGSTAGTYGVNPSTCANGAGTCSDSGSGYGYSGASGLEMNIFFDLSGQPQSASAELDFVFDDLDLTDINDPNNFYESMSLSYWDGSAFASLNSPTIIKSSADMDGVVNVSAIDPITWNLDLASILGDLNASQSSDNGFWIQLGFGSKYNSTGWNTPEYLTASLTVAPVPVPAAVWLFGTALIGFVGMSRRTVVT